MGRRAIAVEIRAAVVAAICCCAAYAQDPPVEDPGVPPPTDAYGNPQPDRSERRPLGLPESSPSTGPSTDLQQPTYLFDYSPPGIVSRQRGGYVPFALMGDLLNIPRFQGRSLRRPVTPESRLLSSTRRRAFSRYGGFGERDMATTPGMHDAMARRHGLIAATSLNAPVYRAKMRGGASVTSSTGAQVRDGATPGDSVAATTLHERPAANVQVDRARAKSDGWAAFKEREYRRAAREFETAYSLDPADSEARTAEVFSYVLTGSMRTAVTLMGQFDREGALFEQRLSMDERFGRPDETQKLTVQATTATNARDTGEDVKALYTFLLWHLGHPAEALASARELAKKGSRSYGHWAGEMERSLEVSQEGRSEPGSRP